MSPFCRHYIKQEGTQTPPILTSFFFLSHFFFSSHSPQFLSNLNSEKKEREMGEKIKLQTHRFFMERKNMSYRATATIKCHTRPLKCRILNDIRVRKHTPNPSFRSLGSVPRGVRYV